MLYSFTLLVIIMLCVYTLLNAIKLPSIMLNLFKLCGIILSINMLCDVMHSVIMLDVAIQRHYVEFHQVVIILNGITLNVEMLSVFNA